MQALTIKLVRGKRAGRALNVVRCATELLLSGFLRDFPKLSGKNVRFVRFTPPPLLEHLFQILPEAGFRDFGQVVGFCRISYQELFVYCLLLRDGKQAEIV